MSNKIIDLKKMLAEPTDWTSWPKYIGPRVLCHGCFDLLHYGHIKHLQEACKLYYGDGKLFVTVTPDRFMQKRKPIFNERQRVECLASLECVDFVAINQWPTAVETIRAIKPKFYVKGREYEGKTTPALEKEKEEVERIGGTLVFLGDDCCHTTDLLNHLKPVDENPDRAVAFVTLKNAFEEFARYETM